jgi:hypothetical protein
MDLLPLTLDKTNNRVGINNTTPDVALAVTGHASVTGNLEVKGFTGIEGDLTVLGDTTLFNANVIGKVAAGTVEALDTTTGTLHLGAIPNSSKSNVLMYDTTTKEVSYGSSPASDIAPITLDKVNNRVGINFASPSYTLGVGGDANLATGGTYRINGFSVLGSKATDTTVTVGITNAVPDTSTNAVCIGMGANVGVGAVSIGANAGVLEQGLSAVAIGFSAGKYRQKKGAVAIGHNAAQATSTIGTEQGEYGVAVGAGSGEKSQGGGAVAIGLGAGQITQGTDSVGIGNGAASLRQGTCAVAIGKMAGMMDQSVNSIAIGQMAGYISQHANSIILNATGAALDSDGASRFYVKPIRSLVDASMPRLWYNSTTGEICYGDSTSNSLLPITLDKVNNRVGINKTAPTDALDVTGNVNSTGVYRIGGTDFVASRNTNAVAIGVSAGLTSQGTSTVAVGNLAGNNTQGGGGVAVGVSAGRYTQGINAVAIGNSAGTGTTTAGTGQGGGAVAIGNSAGVDTQGSNSVAVGINAGRYTQGAGAVAIGSSAGTGTTTAGTGQGSNAVAVGLYAGQDTQGTSSVAVGNIAGRYTQGSNAVAIGNQAGQGTTTAGTGQGGSAVAIGNAAGLDTQGAHAVAIGTSAGNSGQGSYAVAIGRLAGQTIQHANSIILNATGVALNSDGASRFYVKPIRSLVDASMPRLWYNSTTGEICYGDSTSNSLLPITLDKVNTRVGINKTVPTTALDVGGTVTATGLSLTGIPNTTTTNTLYYDTTTKAVSYGAGGSSTPVYTEGFLAADITKGADGQKVIFTVPLTPGVYDFQASIIAQVETVRSTFYIRYGATGTIMNSVTHGTNSSISTAYVATLTQLIRLTVATDILVCCNSQGASQSEMIYANTPIAYRTTAKTGWCCVKLA